MKILNGLKAIKEYQVSILIAFTIVSILYGIHMFRYEYIKSKILDYSVSYLHVYRIDRITNEVCYYIFPAHLGGSSGVSSYSNDTMKIVELCD